MSKITERLKRYPLLPIEINSLKLELERLEYIGIESRSEVVRPSTPTYSIHSTVENQVSNMEQRRSYLDQAIKNKELDIQIIDNALSVLSDEQRELVKLRYFQGLTQELISEQMNIGVKTVYVWSKKALELLEPLICV